MSLGAKPVFTEFSDIPEALYDRVTACRILRGRVRADGVYTDGEAEALTFYGFNSDCSSVERLLNSPALKDLR